MPSQIYNLDHASGAPLNKQAKKAIKEFLSEPIYNTDSSYAPAVKLRRDIDELKSKIAKLLGVKSPNIFICAGSSDATKKLFTLISLAFKKGEVITTNVEHSSLLAQLDVFSKKKILHVGPTGQIDLAKLKDSISDRTILVSVQYVNNETGQVMPIKEISSIIKEVRADRDRANNKLPIFFHSDASQAATTQDLLVPRLGVDAMSINGSKFGSLPNSGLLYLSPNIIRWLSKNKVEIKEAKNNPLTVISLYHSLKHATSKKNTESKRIALLAQAFWSELKKLIPEAELTPKGLTIGKKHSSHIINIHITGVSSERLVILAGLNDILISTGAACSASRDKPSHVLEALGLSKEKVQSSIRVSFGSGNKTEKEVRGAAKKLAGLCQNKSVKL